MYIKKITQYSFLLMLIGGFFTSCEKMDGTYDEFITSGQKVYNAKPENLQIFSGKNRVKLKWYIISDPKITSAKIFWNNPGQVDGALPGAGERVGGRDSLKIDITRTNGTDSVSAIIDRLTEGAYTFEVYMYDNEGHRSIKDEIIGDVYGATFQNSLSDRPLDKPILDTTEQKSNLYIPWFGIAQQAVAIELQYTDISSTEKSRHIVRVPHPIDPRKGLIWQESDTLVNYKEGTSFKYRTAYLPEATAIDTFYTDFAEVSDIGYFVPPPPPSVNANLALGKNVTTSSSGGSALTDGDRTNGSGKWQPSSGERADLNVWAYVDLGEASDINTTQVYFSKDPNKITYYEVLTTNETSIGSSTKWIRAFIKFGQPDDEDINSFSTVKARFVKVNIGLRDSATNINLSEIEVYKN